jgi:hypothetical protein
MWPDVLVCFSDDGWLWPEIARCLPSVAPPLAPRNLVSIANVRGIEHSEPFHLVISRAGRTWVALVSWPACQGCRRVCAGCARSRAGPFALSVGARCERWLRRPRAEQWRAAHGQNRTAACIGSREVSRSCRGWAPSARRPATASTCRCTWCPARLLSRMGQVPGADIVQGAAGEQVVAWLPGVGGDAGGERWRRWPGGVRGELAGAPGPSQ